MINRVISAVSEAINQTFGDDYEIYTENIEQGLKEPCFSIVCLNPTSEKVVGKRYFNKHKFCIHYFPSSEDKNHECFEVLERLNDCMECITFENDLIRGTNTSSEITDGVLNFFVSFDFFVYKGHKEEFYMETHKVKTEAKG